MSNLMQLIVSEYVPASGVLEQPQCNFPLISASGLYIWDLVSTVPFWGTV